MRNKGCKTKKLCWDICITQGDIELHKGQYTTLRDAADELGLTYSQICELGPNGRNKKKSITFKFYPTITITKINKDKEYEELQEKQEDPDYLPESEDVGGLDTK